MAAPAPVALSPLGSLDHDEREQVIIAVTEALPRAAAAQLLAALAGTRDELATVPLGIQEEALHAVVAALPAGRNAIVVSTLGIPTKSDVAYLNEVLTAQEKADPVFRRRVEEEARRRRIPRWVAASRLRWNQLETDVLAAAIQRQQGEAPTDRDDQDPEAPRRLE